MRFTKPIVIALIALAKLIVADSQQFGIISIASGTDLQYASGAIDANNNLVLGHNQPSPLTLVVTDDGKLKSATGDEYFSVDSTTGDLKQTSSADATTGFSIKNGHLMYLDSESFFATPSGQGANTWNLVTKGNGSPVVLRAQSITGSDVVADFTPATLSSASSSSTLTNSASMSSEVSGSYSTVGPTTIRTSGVPVSQIDDGQIQVTATTVPPVQSDNGAAGMGPYGVTAGIAAAAAMLLF